MIGINALVTALLLFTVFLVFRCLDFWIAHRILRAQHAKLCGDLRELQEDNQNLRRRVVELCQQLTTPRAEIKDWRDEVNRTAYHLPAANLRKDDP